MFALFGRKREEIPVLRRPTLALSQATDVRPPAVLEDPAAQVELVWRTVEKLDAVRSLVDRLPELPVGDRQTLLDQLAATVESLRALYFLDAIY